MFRTQFRREVWRCRGINTGQFADDVKCSHGSTSGSIDEDSLHYLMTRGIKKEEATKLLIKGFLSDVIEFIKSNSIRNFVESKLDEQVNGH